MTSVSAVGPNTPAKASRGLEYAGCARADAEHEGRRDADGRDARETAHPMHGRLFGLLRAFEQAVYHAVPLSRRNAIQLEWLIILVAKM